MMSLFSTLGKLPQLLSDRDKAPVAKTLAICAPQAFSCHGFAQQHCLAPVFNSSLKAMPVMHSGPKSVL